MSETKMINIRLPVELKEQIRSAAEKDSRTVTGLITVILKTWLAEQKTDDHKTS